MTHSEEQAIKWAYKNLSEKEFLDRITDFVNTLLDLKDEKARMEVKASNNIQRLCRASEQKLA